MGTEALQRMSEQESRVADGINPGTKRSLPSGSIVNIASGAGLRGVREYYLVDTELLEQNCSAASCSLPAP
jgi:hypothetical protein